MGNTDKIRQEIERRKKENMYVDLPMSIGRYYEDRDLLAFIDSLQQEQPEVDKKTFDDYLKASPAERRKINMTEILGKEKLAKTKKQMEQPAKIDWESEIEEYWTASGWSKNISLGKFKVIARYFIGLALEAPEGMYKIE